MEITREADKFSVEMTGPYKLQVETSDIGVKFIVTVETAQIEFEMTRPQASGLARALSAVAK